MLCCGGLEQEPYIRIDLLVRAESSPMLAISQTLMKVSFFGVSKKKTFKNINLLKQHYFNISGILCITVITAFLYLLLFYVLTPNSFKSDPAAVHCRCNLAARASFKSSHRSAHSFRRNFKLDHSIADVCVLRSSLVHLLWKSLGAIWLHPLSYYRVVNHKECWIPLFYSFFLRFDQIKAFVVLIFDCWSSCFIVYSHCEITSVLLLS